MNLPCKFALAVLTGIALVPTAAQGQIVLDQGGTRATKHVRSLKEMREASVVHQRWDLSCGAAALSTLLTHDFKDPTPETAIVVWLLHRTNPVRVKSRGGFSLLDLKHFARSRGYSAEGYSGMSLKEVADLHGPAIVPIHRNGYDHFVVIREIIADRIVVADPAFGNVTMKVTRFLRIWKDGIVFLLHPPEPFMNSRQSVTEIVPQGAIVYRALQHSAPSTPLRTP